MADLSVLDDLEKFTALTEEEQAALLEDVAAKKGEAEVPKSADKAVKETEDAVPQAEGQPEGEAEPQGEAQPDGEKHPPGFVPRQRMKEETRKRQAAEAVAQQFYAKAQELAGELEALRSQPGNTIDASKIDSHLDKIKEFYGDEAAEPIRAIVETLIGEVEAAKRDARVADKRAESATALAAGPIAERQVNERSDIESVEAEVRAANPYLAQWQQMGGAVWQAAQDIDAAVAMSPVLERTLQRGGTKAYYEQRYAMVVEQMRREFDIPEIQQPSAPPASADPLKTAREQVQAQLAKASPPVPRTLSDIPSGAVPPATDESARVRDLTSTEVWAKVGSMSPDKALEWLEAHGAL